MNPNIFRMTHHKYGVEEFEINDARYNLHNKNDGVWKFTLYFGTFKSLIRHDDPDEIFLDYMPNFEVTALLEESDLDLKVAKRIVQKESWDDKRKENLSNIYHFEHAGIEKVEIELVKVENNSIFVNIKAIGLVYGTNGNSPDTDFWVENTRFVFDETLTRGVC